MTDDKSIDSKWSVRRLDDNGNEFVVKADLTREQAEEVAREFEDRGHKQDYWVWRNVD